VTVADWLLVVVAVVGITSAILTFTTLGTVSDVTREAYQGTELEGTEGQSIIGSVVGGVLGILFAIAFIILAFFNNRGKNASRIVTWVLGGISLCCSGAALGLTAILGSIEIDTQDAPDPAELQERINDALPSWYPAVSLTLAILSILTLVVALLLLALPRSNEFFRKPEQPFQPPEPNYPQVG
jgi:MFS family permease